MAKFIVVLMMIVLNVQASADELLTSGKLAKPERESTIKLQSLPTAAQDQESQKVLLNLLEKAGWFPNLKVSVEMGLVTIDGKVDDQGQLDWLVRTADRLPSVIAVINKASVDRPADLTPVKNEVRGWVVKVRNYRCNCFVGGILFRTSSTQSTFIKTLVSPNPKSFFTCNHFKTITRAVLFSYVLYHPVNNGDAKFGDHHYRRYRGIGISAGICI